MIKCICISTRYKSLSERIYNKQELAEKKTTQIKKI